MSAPELPTRRQLLKRLLARIAATPAGILPPCDLPAEQRLVGACLTDPAHARSVLSVISPECFADNVHAEIMEAIRDGNSPYALNLDEVGGTRPYLAQLRDIASYPGDILGDMASILATHGMRLSGA
jgi:hypothetical protein